MATELRQSLVKQKKGVETKIAALNKQLELIDQMIAIHDQANGQVDAPPPVQPPVPVKSYATPAISQPPVAPKPVVAAPAVAAPPAPAPAQPSLLQEPAAAPSSGLKKKLFSGKETTAPTTPPAPAPSPAAAYVPAPAPAQSSQDPADFL